MITNPTSRGRVLIVDDEPANVRLFQRILQKSGFEKIEGTSDPLQATTLYESFTPDIVLLDLRMPGKDGFEVLGELRDKIDPEEFLPIVILTGAGDSETKLRALAAGAIDFLTKPIDSAEFATRVQNLVRMRGLHQEVLLNKRTLEERVQERTRQLREAQAEVVDRLGKACEFRDDDTGQHTERVGEVSARIAQHLGLGEGFVELIREAAPLHDIGKVGIPDRVLLKPGKLTPDEWSIMKTHTKIGGSILSGSPHRILNMAEEIALTHHERPDGKGYAAMPGEAIPIAGRIVAIADVFDALTHERPYKKAWPFDQARDEILKHKGAQFDPAIVDAFMTCYATADSPMQMSGK